MKNDELFTFIENQKDLVIEIQKGLTSHPAMGPDNGGTGETEKFLFLKEYLSSWGFDSIKEFFAPDTRVPTGNRPSLLAEITGKDTTKSLWIITHLDVVPPGNEELWKTPPFEAVVKGDNIYGRGTEDNQQGTVSSLVAAKALLQGKIKPAINIKLLFVADEEVGSDYGVKWLLDNTDLFSNKDDLILTPDVGDPEGKQIEIAEKSILWAVFEIQGKQSHGSRPDLGTNTTRASSNLCVQLDKMFHETYTASNSLFDLPASTFEPTKHHSAVANINTIPGFDSLAFDCRILPQYDLDEVLENVGKIVKQIEETYKVSIEVKTPQKVQAPPPTPEDAPIMTLLQKSIKKITGISAVPYGIGGGTVAAYFRMRGIHAALWSTAYNTMHEPNEYSSIKNTLSDAKVFFHMMINAE